MGAGSTTTDPAASYLLVPGRHLVNTKFQEQYLLQVLRENPATLPGFNAGRARPSTLPHEVIFAITSANRENSRYNPVPFHIRAIGVDRFARQLQGETSFRYRILGIPHYGHNQKFAAFAIKEIADQTEKAVRLTPENCLVLTSTPEVISLFQEVRAGSGYRAHECPA